MCGWTGLGAGGRGECLSPVSRAERRGSHYIQVTAVVLKNISTRDESFFNI